MYRIEANPFMTDALLVIGGATFGCERLDFAHDRDLFRVASKARAQPSRLLESGPVPSKQTDL
jgi:hypothetical protein